jgi:hypothetical protein
MPSGMPYAKPSTPTFPDAQRPHLPNHIDMECGTIRDAGVPVAVWIRAFGELALQYGGP